jgi:hypothetical protein
MAWELLLFVAIWKPLQGGAGLYSKDDVDGSEDFYRNWTDYKTGFGNLSGEFWLGLDKIHLAIGQNVLRIDLETFENETAYAIYGSFSVGNESEVYILNVGNYSGTNKYSYKFLECMYTEKIPSIRLKCLLRNGIFPLRIFTIASEMAAVQRM